MKKLLFVSGKGGVGKTTISLALGLSLSQRKKKTLLVEVNSEEQVSHLLQRKPVGHEETPLLPDLYGLNLDPQKAFKEYILSRIHLQTVYRTVFENRWVKNFIEGTPGLSHLMMIGKIYSLRDTYDHMIVDAPATGHALALLQIASIVASAVRVGPLRKQAEAIDEWLHDSENMGVVLVTLPEELPVTETMETTEKLTSIGFNLDLLILNQAVSPPLNSAEKKEFNRLSVASPIVRAMKIEIERGGRTEWAESQLKQIREVPPLKIPFFYKSSFGLPEIEEIAQCLTPTI